MLKLTIKIFNHWTFKWKIFVFNSYRILGNCLFNRSTCAAQNCYCYFVWMKWCVIQNGWQNVALQSWYFDKYEWLSSTFFSDLNPVRWSLPNVFLERQWSYLNSRELDRKIETNIWWTLKMKIQSGVPSMQLYNFMNLCMAIARKSKGHIHFEHLKHRYIVVQ